MMDGLDLLDLQERLKNAEKMLREMAEKGSTRPEEKVRLTAKVAGVALARGFVEEYMR